MRSLFLTVICLFLMAQYAGAQAPGNGADSTDMPDIATGVEDSAVMQEVMADILGDTTLYINRISLGKDSFNRWKSEKSFTYMKYLDSMLRAKKAGLKEKPSERATSHEVNWLERILTSSVAHALLWVIAGLFVLFIIYRLFLQKGIFVRYARQENVSDLGTEKEELQDTDFMMLLRQAVAQADYRKAVRYQYLHSLQQLSAKGMLQLSAEKTNAAYVRELNGAQRQAFAALTLLYEYAWFGHQQVSESMYRNIERDFDQFNNG